MRSSKRVLIFIEDGSFTYDNRVIREAQALCDNGYEVCVLSPRYKGDPLHKELAPNLHAYYYPKPNAQGAMGHVLEHSVSLLLGSVGTAFIAARHGFKVFHACNPMDIGWLIALPYLPFGARYLFDQHDLCPELYLSRGEGDETSPFFRALSWLERRAYKHAKTVVATNESYKRIAIERGGKAAESVFVVRNGPDLAKFKQVPPAAGFKNEGQLLVGYLGNMNKQDGVEELLFAAEELIKKQGRKDLRFVFIGGGAHQPELKAEAQRMGLGDVVSFTGRLPDAEMLAALNACDVCVQPDPKNPLNDKSTMNKVMEYMALKKPVIAYDLVETRVSCGDAAVLVDPKEPMGLAKAIRSLAERPEERARLAVAGYERVQTVLAWPFSVPKLLAAYQHALDNA